MTPEDEIERIIRESISSDFAWLPKVYYITTFPEILIKRLPSCFMITISDEHNENEEVIRRCEKLAISLRASKILIENRILDKYRKIILTLSDYNDETIPIYYKDCIFAFKQDLISENCENCIINVEVI